MKSIEILVSPDGQTRLETKGFSGGQCRDVSRLLEAALGETTSERLTAEFYQARTDSQNHLEQEA